MSKLVGSVGLVCTDIVNFIPKFPEEDADLRCATQSWERGGNATNTATVLACLGTSVEFVGTLANDKLLTFLREDMDSLGIRHDNCPVITGCGDGPISVVLCAKESGTRTIVHAKGRLPELTLQDFEKLSLDNFAWMHFEGRNANVLPGMLELIKRYNEAHNSTTDPAHFPKYKRTYLPVSLEVELHIDNLDIMLPLVDIVLVGKDYARYLGALNCTEAAEKICTRVEPGTICVCAWGEQGASYCVATSSPENLDIKTQSAYVPKQIVDSLGAGDTFNGVVIHCLHKGLEIEEAVDFACLVASKKLEMHGIKALKGILPQLLPSRVFQ